MGRVDFDRLARELSSRDVAELFAFERIEGGIGSRAVKESAALLAALYAERNRDAKRRPAPYSEADFLPWVEKPKPSAAAFRAAFAPLVKKGG